MYLCSLYVHTVLEVLCPLKAKISTIRKGLDVYFWVRHRILRSELMERFGEILENEEVEGKRSDKSETKLVVRSIYMYVYIPSCGTYQSLYYMAFCAREMRRSRL